MGSGLRDSCRSYCGEVLKFESRGESSDVPPELLTRAGEPKREKIHRYFTINSNFYEAFNDTVNFNF